MPALVDQKWASMYNIDMLKNTKTRKRRQDRRHAIYCLTNTQTGEIYIGITVCSGAPIRAIRVRWQKHVRRALTENRDWSLCQSIRSHGADVFERELIEVVRGRLTAHARERELIRQYAPGLNSY